MRLASTLTGSCGAGSICGSSKTQPLLSLIQTPHNSVRCASTTRASKSFQSTLLMLDSPRLAPPPAPTCELRVRDALAVTMHVNGVFLTFCAGRRPFRRSNARTKHQNLAACVPREGALPKSPYGIKFS
jgi:hypothetical protein